MTRPRSIHSAAGDERPDGGVLLVYKAVEYAEGKIGGGKVRCGVAMADEPEGQYTKKPGRIFESDDADAGKLWMLTEDPYIWFSKSMATDTKLWRGTWWTSSAYDRRAMSRCDSTIAFQQSAESLLAANFF
jgi:hypothetical protein